MPFGYELSKSYRQTIAVDTVHTNRAEHPRLRGQH